MSSRTAKNLKLAKNCKVWKRQEEFRFENIQETDFLFKYKTHHFSADFRSHTWAETAVKYNGAIEECLRVLQQTMQQNII